MISAIGIHSGVFAVEDVFADGVAAVDHADFALRTQPLEEAEFVEDIVSQLPRVISQSG